MYEDFYNEGPSDYELFMNDLKETLKKSIKDEFIKEMDKLRAENKKLRNVKENFEKIKLDYAHKEQELKAREQDMEKNLARKKIMELATIADMKAQIYYIDDGAAYLPKCDKCDENRLIHFKSPSGRECTESCPNCGTTYYKYYVKPVDTLKILFPNDPAIHRVAYYLRRDRWGETYSYERLAIYNKSYNEIEIKPNSVIYLDPPYKFTNKYEISKDFDYEKFYSWCERQTELCFISEYSMPKDRFTCIAEIEHRSIICANENQSVIERVFLPNHQVKDYKVPSIFDL